MVIVIIITISHIRRVITLMKFSLLLESWKANLDAIWRKQKSSWTKKQKLLSSFLRTRVEQIRNNLEIQRSFQWLTLMNEVQSQTQSKMTSNVQIGVMLTFILMCYALLTLWRKGISDRIFSWFTDSYLFAGLIHYWLYKLFSGTSTIISIRNKRVSTRGLTNPYLSCDLEK